MRSGKLGISRGHQLNQPVGPTPRLALVPRTVEPKRPRSRKSSAPPSAAQLQQALAAPPQPVPATPEYRFVHDRLSALERLAKLRDTGIITPEEFDREKALVFNPPVDELLLEEAPQQPVIGPHRPSPRVDPADPLVSQLFSWRFLPVGVGLGLLLSYASQPRETVRFFGDIFGVLVG